MFYRFMTHVFALIILTIIAIAVIKRKRYWNTQIRLYLVLIIGTMGLLLLDVLSGVLDGAQFPGAVPLHYAVNVLFFIAIPTLSGYFWFLYVDYYIAKEAFYRKSTNILLMIPLFVIALLSFASIFGDFFFTIDSLNQYAPGTYYWINIGTTYGYYGIATIYVIMYRMRIRKEDLFPMLMYPLPALMAGLIEIATRVNITWSVQTIVLFLFFIHFMQVLINTDHLTRVANRFELDKYAEQLTDRIPANRVLGGLMIDINCFKQINDQYGHSMGDTALTMAANILRSSVRKEDFVARYGGDEFVILCLLKSPHHLNIILARIFAHVNDQNNKSAYPFKLSFSIGHGIYTPSVDKNVPNYIRRLDSLMYEEKKKYCLRLEENTAENAQPRSK